MRMTDEMRALRALCLEAGAVLLDYFHGGVAVESKADDSPVTEADRRAEAIILAGLAKAFPGVPVVAEEEVAAGRLPEEVGERFFLVDPLDGTREFISGRGDFTVNIALVEKGIPVMGAVYAPHRGSLYLGRLGEGAVEETVAVGSSGGEVVPLRVRAAPRVPPVAVASRSHRDAETDALLTAMGVSDTVSVGSSLKFCLVARGEADLYPRFGRTMEWDTAAGHGVLLAAGGSVSRLDGAPFLYGKRNQPHDADFANPGFLAAGTGDLVRAAAAKVAGTSAAG